MPDMTKYPMRGSNKASMRGEAKDKKNAGDKHVADLEIGSSDGDGIRFQTPSHPDFSNVRSPEKM
jgi:hypothetical protein